MLKLLFIFHLIFFYMAKYASPYILVFNRYAKKFQRFNQPYHKLIVMESIISLIIETLVNLFSRVSSSGSGNIHS